MSRVSPWRPAGKQRGPSRDEVPVFHTEENRAQLMVMYRRNIARCEVEILPGAGHVMGVDEPEFVAGRIARFLEAPSDGDRTRGRSEVESAVAGMARR